MGKLWMMIPFFAVENRAESIRKGHTILKKKSILSRKGDNESNLIDCQQVTIAICTMCIHKMHIVQEFTEISIKGGC